MNTSKERHILNEDEKVSARWMPHLRKVDQKRVRITVSNALLAKFRCNKSRVLVKINYCR